jgi:hypothetical protein
MSQAPTPTKKDDGEGERLTDEERQIVNAGIIEHQRAGAHYAIQAWVLRDEKMPSAVLYQQQAAKEYQNARAFYSAIY